MMQRIIGEPDSAQRYIVFGLFFGGIAGIIAATIEADPLLSATVAAIASTTFAGLGTPRQGLKTGEPPIGTAAGGV